MRPRKLALVGCACLALALLGGAPAQAAPKQAPSVIKLVSPMRVLVGHTIAIRGRGFSPRRASNTVVFKAPNGLSAFAKPRRASARKLVVMVPAAVERLLVNGDSKGVGSPTRIGIRVLVKRRYGKRSARRNSPVVVSALKSGAPAACGTGSDFDNDLIPNSVEAQIKTDPCNADSDGDGVEDGFEQESARDLNQRAVPYPGKRPFPNALDAGDAGNDYDGDGLSNRDEFRAWAKAAASPPPSTLQFYVDGLSPDSRGAPAFGGSYADRPRFGNHALPMSYSDGDQTTVVVRPGSPEYKYYLDTDEDGSLSDDERDADGDGLSNHDELYKLMKVAYYPASEQCSYGYKPALPRNFLEPDYLDWDSDGDGVWDGNDDQDSDDVSNVDEIRPPYLAPSAPTEPEPGGDPAAPAPAADRWTACGSGKPAPLPVDGARDGSEVLRSPYNPCQPYVSRTCNRYVPR